MGNVTPVDSANIFIENTDYISPTTGATGSLLTVSSATGTYTSGDIVNRTNKGAKFFVNFTSINATCTVLLHIQSKDPVSGNYADSIAVSINAASVTAIAVPQIIALYPGLLATLGSLWGGTSPENQFNINVSRTMRIVASITTQATSTVVAAAFTIGVSRLR